MQIVRTFLMVSGLFLTGCATISSSYHYTKGTECLEKGEFNEAVIELEKAVQLDPEIARNHCNLAYAYLRVGRCEEYWIQSRQAVLCPFVDEASYFNFEQLCHALIEKPGLNRTGTGLEEVLEKLGSPDIRRDSDDKTETICAYGTCIMKFIDKKLTVCEFD